jgi:hypothetical protein
MAGFYQSCSLKRGHVVRKLLPGLVLLGAYADLYHFVGLPVSAIVTDPTSGVPEPSSWAMMVGGFGLIGTAMRRRARIHFA